jgi:hypothetical protein
MNTVSTTETKEVRSWLLLCHLSAFAAYLVPFGNIFGPLLVYLLKRDEIPAIEEHGKEALNFNISMTIYGVISIFLVLFLIGIPLVIAVWVFSTVATVIAAVRADNGELYQYPLTIRFLR